VYCRLQEHNNDWMNLKRYSTDVIMAYEEGDGQECSNPQAL